ncbi:MAG: hypothetical protein J7M25_07315 [Deltaproteobacteria bacterium]|nr:hypothetical protein [Deltaproteobacteria bacterium]
MTRTMVFPERRAGRWALLGLWVVTMSIGSVASFDASARPVSRKWTVYRNKHLGIQFLVARGWRVNDFRTHPSLIMGAHHSSGAEIRLSMKVFKVRESLLSFARDEVRAVRAIGFPVSAFMPAKVGSSKALMVRGTDPKKPMSFRLYFFSKGHMYYVLTFTYPTKAYPRLWHAYKLLLVSFVFKK